MQTRFFLPAGACIDAFQVSINGSQATPNRSLTVKPQYSTDRPYSVQFSDLQNGIQYKFAIKVGNQNPLKNYSSNALFGQVPLFQSCDYLCMTVTENKHVQAVSSRFNGAEAIAVSVPCADAPPSPPTNLTVITNNGEATLVWGPPQNGKCQAP
jgi:hypothetical protein